MVHMTRAAQPCWIRVCHSNDDADVGISHGCNGRRRVLMVRAIDAKLEVFCNTTRRGGDMDDNGDMVKKQERKGLERNHIPGINTCR